MPAQQLAALFLLGAMWGGSFLFMRIAAPVLGPVPLIALRVLIAGLLMLPYAAWRGHLKGVTARWRTLLVTGVVNSGLPFVLIATATLTLPASLAATLNATTPLFGAVVAAIWLGERLTLRQVAGFALGLVGVATLVGLGPVPLSAKLFWSVGASLLAAIAYGIGAVYTKVKVADLSPLALTTCSQLGAGLALLPLVPFTLRYQVPSLPVVGSVLALAILCTAVAYLIYFYLILHAGPTRAVLVTYLSPAFGLLWGALILGERLTVGAWVGFAMIITSLLVVNGVPGRSPTK